MSLREIIPSSFVELLDLFGISIQGQKDNTFVLTGDVTPVVLVGSTTTIQSVSTPILQDVPFTIGSAAAPVAGTVLADTLAQTPGVYAYRAQIGTNHVNAGFDWNLQRRDAANAASIWEQRGSIINSSPGYWDQSGTLRLQSNERLRIQCVTNAGAGTVIQANIWLVRIGD